MSYKALIIIKKTMINKKEKKGWDSPENEAQNNFVSWGKIGDFVYGTFLGSKKVKSTLPGKEGQLQNVYTIRVKEALYHNVDEDKKCINIDVVPMIGDTLQIGGRPGIDDRMLRLKIGQIFGLKFVEEFPAKVKGYSKAKGIKVFTPTDGVDSEGRAKYEMDEEYLAELKSLEVSTNKDF